jgi:hypothetical protein
MTAAGILTLRRDVAASLALLRHRDPRFAEALEIVLGPPPAGSASYAAAVQQRPHHLRAIAARNRYRARSAGDLAGIVETIIRRYERAGWQDHRLDIDAPEHLTADEADAWAILRLFGLSPRKATVERDIRGCF